MKIFRLYDECGAYHWVFAEDEPDAVNVVGENALEQGMIEPGSDPLVIETWVELTLAESEDVRIRPNGGPPWTLAALFENDPGRRYVGCSEW